MNNDFLLQTPAAVRLYHDYAKNEPICDYHCHLPPEQIAQDTRFENLTQLWLYGDHYKWRLMRANGIDEIFCTGEATDEEKFLAWAKTVPYIMRNPIYHWTHMELKRPFGISGLLFGPDTAKMVWEECSEKLKEPEFSARGIMKMMNVRLVCTTDDPADSLEHHKKIAADDSFDIKVYPTFRPDKAMAVEIPENFNSWTDKLAGAADVDIKDFTSFMNALQRRHQFFHDNGCRVSDHGLECAYGEDYTDKEIAGIFLKIRSGTALSNEDALKFKSAMLVEFGRMDHEKEWTQQFHFAAMRSNNSRMLKKLGPDTGYDSIGDFALGRALAKFLDRLESQSMLTRTILYSLNPCHNELLASMIGNYQDGSEPGKMQWGSAWWFNDHKDGMERQIETLSNMGLLSRFVGMLTDSRSFLSYPRHEYFRRILCNMIGDDVEKGLLPKDFDLLGGMVRDISYQNAVKYFRFDI